MNSSPYTVLITASGKGSGLGKLNQYTNKTLLRVGHKPAISSIIDSYPKSTEFVITIGHYGNHVKEFLNLAYPKCNFTFVEVDKYEGAGSSLGYSMMQASTYLKKPFIYHASDTIVLNHIPKPTFNWIGGYEGVGSSNYTSFNILNGRIQKILDKGIIDPDYLHIGLVGIYDFKLFWTTLKKLLDKNIYKGELSDYHVYNQLIEEGTDFKIHEFVEWHDVGNLEALRKTREKINDTFHILDKEQESLFMLNNNVYKFFYNPDYVTKRVKRATILNGLVPKILDSTKNFYVYSFVKGELYADSANPSNFKDFLLWSKNNLWKDTQEVPDSKFKEICHDFYYKKTQERLTELFKSRNLKDASSYINGEKVPEVKTMLKKIDFDWLASSKQTLFHGDFILDNIIQTKKGYSLLDWRQDFGGLIKAGDMYYDLAKLNHNLTVNHGIINGNQFSITIEGDTITCDIHRLDRLVRCQEIYWQYLKDENLDSKKVKILTSLIWLNMSPLHHHPFDLFLFYFGKYNLWKALNE